MFKIVYKDKEIVMCRSEIVSDDDIKLSFPEDEIEIVLSEKEAVCASDGKWYFIDEIPAPSHDEQSEKRAEAYRTEVDPITSHIERLRDEEPDSPKIAELLAERAEKVAQIKEQYPYYDGE